jgi:hypothetical protein
MRHCLLVQDNYIKSYSRVAIRYSMGKSEPYYSRSKGCYSYSITMSRRDYMHPVILYKMVYHIYAHRGRHTLLVDLSSS